MVSRTGSNTRSENACCTSKCPQGTTGHVGVEHREIDQFFVRGGRERAHNSRITSMAWFTPVTKQAGVWIGRIQESVPFLGSGFLFLSFRSSLSSSLAEARSSARFELSFANNLAEELRVKVCVTAWFASDVERICSGVVACTPNVLFPFQHWSEVAGA
jgi:hypothetical protein